jgi:hypothetical protein
MNNYINLLNLYFTNPDLQRLDVKYNLQQYNHVVTNLKDFQRYAEGRPHKKLLSKYTLTSRRHLSNFLKGYVSEHYDEYSSDGAEHLVASQTVVLGRGEGYRYDLHSIVDSLQKIWENLKEDQVLRILI